MPVTQEQQQFRMPYGHLPDVTHWYRLASLVHDLYRSSGF
jgi:hypothetical protein